MADVFLSYAREDRDRAAQIAEALIAGGYTVFWDVQIPPGRSWADVLSEKLNDSKAALVLWSAHSTASEYVREEARLARDRRKLIPVMLDNSSPPFGFGEIQAANLADWNGQSDHPQWKLLLEGVAYAVGRSASGPAKAAPLKAKSSPAAAPKSAGGVPLWAIIAGGVVAVIALLGVAATVIDNASEPAAVEVLDAETERAPPIDAADGTVPALAAGTPKSAADAARRAVEWQGKAKQTAQQAVSHAQAGQQAAMLAFQGDGRYGASQGPLGAVAGDLNALQSGRPASVGLAMAAGTQFYGQMQVNQQTGASTLFGSVSGSGGVTANGEWTYRNDQTYAFVGIGYVPNRFTLEARETGVQDGSGGSGVGVIRYANGERYEGEYRSVGEGAQTQVFRHGRGVLYDARGSAVSAGRFENDQLVEGQ